MQKIKKMPLILFFITISTLFSSCEKEEPINNDLKSRIIAIAKKNHLPTLSILIKSENEIVSFQYKDKNRNIDSRINYGIGSSTKFLASLVVLKCIEENKISLDDPINKYIDSRIFSNIKEFHLITILHLLNHTSGIPDYTKNPSWITSVMSGNPPKNYLEKATLANVPDNSNNFGRFAYSNTNYVILEKIIEIVNQKNAIHVFNDFYTQLNLPNISFTKPLGTTQAFFAQEVNQTKTVSSLVENYGFEGGAYASANDLSIVLQKVFIDKSVLNQESINLMTTWIDMDKYKINFGFGQIVSYGLGLMKFEFNGHIFIGHPGSSLKYQSFAFIEPATGKEIIMLTNCSGNYYNHVFLIDILSEIVKEY